MNTQQTIAPNLRLESELRQLADAIEDRAGVPLSETVRGMILADEFGEYLDRDRLFVAAGVIGDLVKDRKVTPVGMFLANGVELLTIEDLPGLDWGLDEGVSNHFSIRLADLTFDEPDAPSRPVTLRGRVRRENELSDRFEIRFRFFAGLWRSDLRRGNIPLGVEVQRLVELKSYDRAGTTNHSRDLVAAVFPNLVEVVSDRRVQYIAQEKILAERANRKIDRAVRDAAEIIRDTFSKAGASIRSFVEESIQEFRLMVSNAVDVFGFNLDDMIRRRNSIWYRIEGVDAKKIGLSSKGVEGLGIALRTIEDLNGGATMVRVRLGDFLIAVGRVDAFVNDRDDRVLLNGIEPIEASFVALCRGMISKNEIELIDSIYQAVMGKEREVGQ